MENNQAMNSPAIEVIDSSQGAKATEEPQQQKLDGEKLAEAEDALNRVHTATAILDTLGLFEAANENVDGVLKKISSVLHKDVLDNKISIEEAKRVLDECRYAKLIIQPEIYRRHAELLTKNYSQEELDTILGFYGSETGKKFLGGLPDLHESESRINHQWCMLVLKPAEKHMRRDASNIVIELLDKIFKS